MPLVGSFIMPHGALTLSKTDPYVPSSAHCLHDACMEAARQINELRPDYIFLSTPHGISLTDDYVIYGNSKATGMHPFSFFHPSPFFTLLFSLGFARLRVKSFNIIIKYGII